jgi:hypothetical protein
MPDTRFRTVVTESAGLTMNEDTGPEILLQAQARIEPSGSFERRPSSKTLSFGRLIAWSGPADATGGLFTSRH